MVEWKKLQHVLNYKLNNYYKSMKLLLVVDKMKSELFKKCFNALFRLNYQDLMDICK